MLGGSHKLGVHRREDRLIMEAPGNFLHAAAAGHGEHRVHLVDERHQLLYILGITLPLEGDLSDFERFACFHKMHLERRGQDPDLLPAARGAHRDALIAAGQQNAAVRLNALDKLFHRFSFSSNHLCSVSCSYRVNLQPADLHAAPPWRDWVQVSESSR